ncbi:hypothetical protein L1987_76150 [Smallanthus sonchifolius]|uniref:Uncharacterized protein n=1 Tax=Smallanthus sonchifolius TaxID=185202 RepID=A0ACB9A812_9ASTR|nr:hypothetical protein L1987_76150 [Smallanthus sonchifolius]
MVVRHWVRVVVPATSTSNQIPNLGEDGDAMLSLGGDFQVNRQPSHLFDQRLSACQWANALGSTVIGTVSTKEKAVQAKEDGCHHVIIYKEENFVDRVMEITSGKGVDVVYESIGKDTFQNSMACLKINGHIVVYGMASGEHEPIGF